MVDGVAMRVHATKTDPSAKLVDEDEDDEDVDYEEEPSVDIDRGRRRSHEDDSMASTDDGMDANEARQAKSNRKVRIPVLHISPYAEVN